MRFSVNIVRRSVHRVHSRGPRCPVGSARLAPPRGRGRWWNPQLV